MSPRILDIPIKRKWFDKIRLGKKKTEYRKFGKFWASRLDDKEYDQIRFRNGYTPKAPEIYTEYRGVQRNPDTREYEIKIGRVVRTRYLRRKNST
jgi:hypothetical protein